MARENTITLVGTALNKPLIYYNEAHDTYRLTFNIKVTRRNGRRDVPKVNIFGLSEEDAKIIHSQINKGVFLMVRGMVSTRLVKKKIRCENCEAIADVDTFVTDVIAYAPPVCLNGNYEADSLREFANNLHLIGNVCTDVNFRYTADCKAVTQFQVAVNRKYHVKEQGDLRADFPWVKCFGEQAEDVQKIIRKTSQIYINGSLQTRDLERNIICNGCQSNFSPH